MGTLTSSPAWKALTEHKTAMEKVHMRDLFAKDPERFAKMSREACGVFVDYSKHRATDETLKLLLAPDPAVVIELMRDQGVLAQFLPEGTNLARLAAMVTVEGIAPAHLVAGADAIRRLAARGAHFARG